MPLLYFWITIALNLEICVLGDSSCPETMRVNGIEGRDVTLEVSAWKITRINWILLPSAITIATIKPGSYKNTDHISPLRGRLAVTSDGSLIIKSLQMEDQRRYKANMNIGEDLISVCFDLRVYEIIQVKGVEGKDVTLEVGNWKITQIDWILLPAVITIATIRLGIYNDMNRNSPLRGRLAATSDGSLIIRSLQMEDQRKYKANINTTEGVITLFFDLRVYGALSESDIRITLNITNPDPCEVALTCSVDGKNGTDITWSSINLSDINVTKNVLLVPSDDLHSIFTCTTSNPANSAFKAVQPQQYCPFDYRKTPYTTVTIIRLALSGSVLLIACCVIIHHMKTEMMRPETMTEDYISMDQ